MLQFGQLSYWEKNALTENIDYVIAGGGIVGSAAAIQLRELHPDAKIVILERGYVSSGASTKNAGFACFGSVTELYDDLSSGNASEVWETVALRWRGLQRLKERFSRYDIGMQKRGSWDLIAANETGLLPELNALLESFNKEITGITGRENCFSYDTEIAKSCSFQGIHGGFYNRLEGELHTGKLLIATQHLLAEKGIITLFATEILDYEEDTNGVLLETNHGQLRTKRFGIATNGFANQLLKDNRVKPARAQVIVTEAIPGFDLPGTFHYQKGYYYFRSVENRLLLGGGRNLDFQGETTTEQNVTELIMSELERMVHELIIPGRKTTIAYRWSGIMGVGETKKPIVEKVGRHTAAGVRMGGMGVAIGSLIGEELAGLLTIS